MWPQGTTISKKACSTRMYPCPTNPLVQETTIRDIPLEPGYQLCLVFRITDGDKITWVQRSDKSDFVISLDSPNLKKRIAENSTTSIKPDVALAPESKEKIPAEKPVRQAPPQLSSKAKRFEVDLALWKCVTLLECTVELLYFQILPA